MAAPGHRPTTDDVPGSIVRPVLDGRVPAVPQGPSAMARQAAGLIGRGRGEITPVGVAA